jgi:hypothetical protein
MNATRMQPTFLKKERDDDDRTPKDAHKPRDGPG